MVYVFTRNKKTGYKRIIKEVETTEEAKELCTQQNLLNRPLWFEFTEDIEWTKNGN